MRKKTNKPFCAAILLLFLLTVTANGNSVRSSTLISSDKSNNSVLLIDLRFNSLESKTKQPIFPHLLNRKKKRFQQQTLMILNVNM